jgi:hypothetical protein
LSRALIGIQVSCSDIALCDVSDRNRLAS